MKKIIKITGWIVAALSFITIPIVLNLTLSTEDSNPDTKINLNNYSLQYLAKVENMTEITEQEAEIIKTELQTKITNEMTILDLTENIDYVINNLNDIKQGSNLNDFFHKIEINSIETSKKTWGKFKIELTVQENINNRSIKVIEIDTEEANELTKEVATSIKNHIKINVQTVVSQGQVNKIDTDYQIINLELIQAGAKFEDYNKKIKVKGISLKLTGEFPITFKIELINDGK